MMKNSCLSVLAVLLLFSLHGCFLGRSKKAEAPQQKQEFRLPAIPNMLVSPEERANYLTAHYWDHFDFSDTTFISRPEISEQAFADFIDLLPRVSPDHAAKAVTNLMEKSSANAPMFAYFTDLAEKYLYDPNSPYRNEDFYIPVLQYIVASPKVADLNKARPRYQLAMVLKNRRGDIAADFVYTTASGRQGKLSGVKSEYTVLFFNSPDCNDCKRVKEYMLSSPVLSDQKRIAVLSVYPFEDVEMWRKAVYPAGWINGYDKGEAIKGGMLYDLKAIPTLYLLDKDKRVLLKDASVEQIEQYLLQNR